MANTEELIYFGSDLKIALNIDFKEIPVDQVEFDVIFSMGNASLTLSKDQLIKVDDKNYIACIKHPSTNSGYLKATLRAKLPDADFSDKIRNVVRPIISNIRIV